MHDEREQQREKKKISGQPVGQDSPNSEYGEIGEQVQPEGGSEPRRSMSTHGTEFGEFNEPDASGQQGQSGTGQSVPGNQAGSTLAGHTDQQDLGELVGEVDQPGSYAGGLSGRQAGQQSQQGEGFIGREGQGALEGDSEDVEGSQARKPKTDVERE